MLWVSFNGLRHTFAISRMTQVARRLFLGDSHLVRCCKQKLCTAALPPLGTHQTPIEGTRNVHPFSDEFFFFFQTAFSSFFPAALSILLSCGLSILCSLSFRAFCQRPFLSQNSCLNTRHHRPRPSRRHRWSLMWIRCPLWKFLCSLPCRRNLTTT